MIGLDTSVIVRYLVGTPVAQAKRAAALIDGDDVLAISLVALAEAAHVLRTQYQVGQRDIIDALTGLIQRENIRLLGIRTEHVVSALVRARDLPGRPIPDALIVASTIAGDALPLATFDRGQARYGVRDARSVRPQALVDQMDGAGPAAAPLGARRATLDSTRSGGTGHDRMDRGRPAMTERHHGLAGDPSMYSDRFLDALVVAATLHRSQRRTGTTVPLISHLLGTCSIALEFGADEVEAIAALLHDVLEDVEPIDEARAAVAAFGPEVLRIVEACTDWEPDATSSWRVQKEHYIARVAQGDHSVLLVAASDKLENVRALVADLHRHGSVVWDRYSPDADRPWYYRTLLDAFRSNPAHEPELLHELEVGVMELERYG